MSNDLVLSASLDDTIRLATALAKSGYYKDIRDAAQGVVKLQIAKEMGLGMRGISDIHIVEGKPTLSYALILSKVRMFTGPLGTDRYSFRYLQRTDEIVEIEWLINGDSVGTSKCDTSDAKRMGLSGRSTWQKYPRQMRTARAVTEGVTAFMPEVIGGSIYTPDELSDGSPLGSQIAGGESGSLPATVASLATLPPALTIKTPDEIAQTMVDEIVSTMSGAEETLEGEVIDYTDTWISACKAFFETNIDHKADYAALLSSAGYLPEGTLTAKVVFSTLAETLGPRCMELDIVIKELQG